MCIVCVQLLYSYSYVLNCVTLNPCMVRGLVGDGVDDLVDFGVDIWLLEIPLTVWTQTQGGDLQSRSDCDTVVITRYSFNIKFNDRNCFVG